MRVALAPEAARFRLWWEDVCDDSGRRPRRQSGGELRAAKDRPSPWASMLMPRVLQVAVAR